MEGKVVFFERFFKRQPRGFHGGFKPAVFFGGDFFGQELID
jgi:hypothetical protein